MNINFIEDGLKKEINNLLGLIENAVKDANGEIRHKRNKLTKLQNIFTIIMHESGDELLNDINDIIEHCKKTTDEESKLIEKRTNTWNTFTQTLLAVSDNLAALKTKLERLQAENEVTEAIRQKKRLLWSNQSRNSNVMAELKSYLRYNTERVDVVNDEIEKKI